MILVGFVMLSVVLMALMANNDPTRRSAMLQQQFGFLKAASLRSVCRDRAAGFPAGQCGCNVTDSFAGPHVRADADLDNPRLHLCKTLAPFASWIFHSFR